MFKALLGSVTGRELSVIKDPFIKDCVGDIAIYKNSWSGRTRWWGKIQFNNGNTSGEQKTPDCETFEEVVAQMKIILDSIQKR